MKQSKNSSRADNQQERLAEFIGWIVGFTDGEGCFSAGFVRQPDRKEKTRTRRGYKTGYQVFPEFAITQGMSSLSALKEIKDFFGVGSLVINKRYDNHNEHLYRYVVRKRQDLLDVIVPFFRKHQLHTTKQRDFEQFSKIVELTSQKVHLTESGLLRIARIANRMNRKKPGKVLARILRDHTPNSK